MSEPGATSRRGALIASSARLRTVISRCEIPSRWAWRTAFERVCHVCPCSEGELAPTVDLVGNVQQNYNLSGVPGERFLNGSIAVKVTVPIYTGGEVYARVRQAKETLGQTRLQADLQRDLIRASVVSSWGQLDTARAVIQSSKAAVKSAEIALDGVRQEAQVGQRTTFDILFQQQVLLNARVSLVSAQRDRVVASYAVMAAIGRLAAANLNLSVAQYDPTVHFDQVKDKWIGLRTP